MRLIAGGGALQRAFGFDHHQRDAVHEQHDVGDAGALGGNAQLAHDMEGVAAGVLEVDQRNRAVAVFAGQAAGIAAAQLALPLLIVGQGGKVVVDRLGIFRADAVQLAQRLDQHGLQDDAVFFHPHRQGFGRGQHLPAQRLQHFHRGLLGEAVFAHAGTRTRPERRSDMQCRRVAWRLFNSIISSMGKS